MKRPPSAPPRLPAAAHFRKEIEKAEASGVLREDMTLELTLSDASHLRRDRSLAVTDISFAGGAMRFLGVRIREGGVAASVLSLPAAPEEAVRAAP